MDPRRVAPDGYSETRRQEDQSGTVRVSELGGYRLIATLGKGHTAKVYLALKRGPAGFTKLVVIKALRRDLVNSLEHIEMFLDEARLSARLNHPNLAQTFEVGEEDGRYFIEMEYLAGQTLRSVYRRVPRGAFPVALQLRILSEIARGLHYAHDLHGFDGEPLAIVHRDVTPHNVMLTYDGHVKLLDFGIAKAEGNDHLTQMGMLKGKADYVAPEQVRGAEVDRRADVFALGAMAYEAVTGRSFSGGAKVPLVTRLHRRISGAEPPVREVNPNVPESLATLIDSATALDPDERVATAQEFADRIDAFLERTHAHVGPSVLSKLLEGPFETDRKRLGQLVEAQCHSARDQGRAVGRHTAVLPVMRPGDTPTGLEMELPPSLAKAARSAPTRRHTSRTSAPAAGHGAVGEPARGVEPLPSERPTPVAPRASTNLTQILSTVLATAALVAAAALWLQRGSLNHVRDATETSAATATPAAAQAPAAPDSASASEEVRPESTTPEAERPAAGEAETAATPEPEPQPELVRIRIQVIPSHARVKLDGALLETPADLALEQSERRHVLWATAPGFEPARRTLTQEEDANLVLRLTRSSSRAQASRPRQHGSTATAEAAPTPAPAPTTASPEAEQDSKSTADEPEATPETHAADSAQPQDSRGIIDLHNPYQ